MVKKSKIEYYKRLAKKYFSSCDEANSACAEKAPLAKPYTLSGLLGALELSREDFFDIGRTKAGKEFITGVMMKIEAFIEENALSGRLSSSASQSSLKYSFGWNEKEKPADDSITVSLSDEVKLLGE